MKNIKQFQGWRAEQIAKVFLLNSGLFGLNKSLSQKDEGYDFIAILKDNPTQNFKIDIKATKYSKKEITLRYIIKTPINESILIQFFINYDKESGFFRIIKQGLTNELQPMKKDIFENAIKTMPNTTYM